MVPAPNTESPMVEVLLCFFISLLEMCHMFGLLKGIVQGRAPIAESKG